MRGLFASLFGFLRQWAWYEPARRSFWRDPDRLAAAKATFAIALLAVPMVCLGHPFFAVSLALGALAGALSETDDHPLGRIKSLALKVACFGISTLSVELLRPYPVFLGLGLASSTVVFLLLGGIGERYRGVTFGAILVGVYAMIGAEISPAWYWQPILLPGGALIYGLFSLLLLFLHPKRLLEETLARGYQDLARYMELKAALFPSDAATQAKIRHELALQNVKLVTSLDRCKDVLNSYRDSISSDEPLVPYLRYFMLLQSLHERAASSHERYELLSDDPRNLVVMEGIGQTLLQLSRAMGSLSESLLTGVPYRHPVSLDWTVKVLCDEIAQGRIAADSPLHLLVDNLSRSARSLRNLSDERVRHIAPQLARDKRSLPRRLLDQLSFGNPRLRYAVRLSLCFLAGFAISEFFQLQKGEWIVLTCLFVLQPSYSETRRRLSQRVLGTLTGVVAGVAIVQILPTVTGQLLFMLASAFAFFFWLRRNYSVSVVFITTFVLCAFNLVAGQGVALMLPRIVDTLIGSALAYASVRLLWPDWQYRNLPGLLDGALRGNADYLAAILAEFRRAPEDDDLAYRIARRAAHRADNALALAWQNMTLEPKKRRLYLDQAFELTYLNHALLSYISAFGAHRMDEASAAEILPLAEETLRALRVAAESAEAPEKGEEHSVDALLAEIKHRARQEEEGVLRQRLALLYNIADVTAQIFARSGRAEEPAA